MQEEFLIDFELLTFPCREMIKLSIHTGVYDVSKITFFGRFE